MKELLSNFNFSKKLVRLGISFIFLTFGAWEIVEPSYWVSFIPSFVSIVFNPLFATRVHGLILGILGILIFISFRKRIISILSSLILLSVCISVFMLLGFSDILVRDIVIFLCCFSLVFEDRG